MLSSHTAFSSYSVHDISEAKSFYEGILELKTEQTWMGILHLYTQGNEPIVLYPKENHIPADFTVLNFKVDDIEDAVDKLSKKGVRFEQYSGEFINTDERGISDSGQGPKMAWFKDPSGNILGLLEG
jgi:predicted enzyme related to lactoylglutathione lyase